jgi:hypothetical protein
MFAINHATTALVIKRASPQTSLLWLLAAVQLVEVLWVILNATGQEWVTVGASVRSLADIQLAHMPWSHSVLTNVLVAIGFGGVAARITKSVKSGVAIGVAVASHLVLDFVTHAPDIPLAPFVDGAKLGMGLYESGLMAAFGIELFWGLTCVALYGGKPSLYVAVLVFNALNFTLYTPTFVGPESFLGGKPMVLVALVGVQIVLTLGVVHRLATQRGRTPPSPSTRT